MAYRVRTCAAVAGSWRLRSRCCALLLSMQPLGLCHDSPDTGCTSIDLGWGDSPVRVVRNWCHATRMGLLHGECMVKSERRILLGLTRYRR